MEGINLVAMTILRIPYGARLIAGIALLFAGLPTAHVLLDGDPWRWAVHAAVVIASLTLIAVRT